VMSDSFDRLLARTERADTAGDGPCPDADVLAAYLDATLPVAERVSVEAHAADCARCALVLATVVRLEDVSSDPPHARARPWRPRMAWMVPAAVAVLVVAIYVAAPRPVLRPAPSLPGAVPAASNAPAESRGPLPAAQAPTPVVPQSRKEATEDGLRMREQLPLRRSPSLAAKAVPAPAPGLPVNPLDDLEPRHRTTMDDRATAVAERPSSPAAMKSDAQRESAGPAQGNTIGAAAAPSIIIRSPDPHVVWRITGAGIERSADGGRSWAREHGPVSGRLVGASPSATVCWLATSEGQVLRRDVDGTWSDVSPAPPLAIVRLESNGPLDATVAGPDGSRDTTVDGGRTWKRESH
jgi:hypothetical protein